MFLDYDLTALLAVCVLLCLLGMIFRLNVWIKNRVCIRERFEFFSFLLVVFHGAIVVGFFICCSLS